MRALKSRTPLLATAVVLMMGTGAACSPRVPSTAKVNLRIGYFANVTHATAMVGFEKGIFAGALGDRATLDPKLFNAGPAAVEAIFSNALDAAYIGPNPAINAFVRSQGAAIRIVSGATSGGTFLVVQPGISSAAELKGRKVASPQLGNTQDVALRIWLASNGLKTDPQGGGDVSVIPQENSQTLETFVSGEIAGAWAPEPWAARLVVEGKGTVLVDERDLWPQGRYVTTHLIVRTTFLKSHREAVKALLKGQIEANDFVNKKPQEAQTLVNDHIGKVMGKKLSNEVVAKAWGNLAFTNDPIASSLNEMAENARKVGLLEESSLAGIYDLSLINEILQGAGEQQVSER
jgi:NitT/TauT family transport system substrate-binding protein